MEVNLDGFIPLLTFENRYLINEFGKIYSIRKSKFLYHYYIKNRMVIDLYKNGKYYTYRIKDLVNLMFYDYKLDIEGYSEIKGFNDYLINKNGNIIHLNRLFGKVISINKISTFIDSCGYVIVELYNNKIRKFKKLHRLIAEYFIPNPNNLPQINHKDENKLNNSISNLEWCTCKENINYGTRNERAIKSQMFKISRTNIKTQEVKIYKSINDCARDMNICASAIKYSIKNNSVYKSMYKFKRIFI